MNRKGIRYYFNGKRRAGRVFRKNFSMYFKYWVFVVASVLARISIVFYPFMEQARYSLITNIEKTNDIKVSVLLEEFEKPKKLWDLFLVFLVRVVIITSGIYLLCIISKLFWILGLEIETIINVGFVLPYDLPFVPTLFMIPMALIALIFTILVLIKNDVTSFTLINNNLNAKDSFSLTNKVYNKKVFRRLFGIYFYTLIDILIKAVLFVGIVFLSEYLFGSVITLGFIMVLAIVLFFILSKTFLTLDFARYHLLKDVLKAYDEEEEVETEEVTEQEQLIILFDENSEVI